ncbi:hypothetical protein LJK88_03875 [Paenibacillus sp. P26]|nr:hypothetical protein LJK88_03875 [Paenibacillus sp. P26]UUZ90771.1 hypothetical protein LJK87_33610 [Paenibacillus sp. P25]
MRKYKKWIRFLLCILSLFLIYNFIIYNLFTRKIDANHDQQTVGDLTRLSYSVGSMYLRDTTYFVPVRHIESGEFDYSKPIDILTIGDSFSNGGGSNYYQDFIATENGFNVLNIQPYNQLNSIETIALLQSSGYLKKVKPKYIIIESVERYAIEKIAGENNLNHTENIDTLMNYYAGKRYINEPPPISFMNTGNFKIPLYSFLYQLSNNAFFSKVYKVELQKDFFSVRNKRDLLFYFQDIKNISKANPITVSSMNQNLNTLAEKLKSDGIKLYFLPAPDKYNLYSDYIKDNPYPKSIFFEELRKLDKDYYFVDTKKILGDELTKGEKDIYYADDTHWGIKASKVLGKTIKFN